MPSSLSTGLWWRLFATATLVHLPSRNQLSASGTTRVSRQMRHAVARLRAPQSPLPKRISDKNLGGRVLKIHATATSRPVAPHRLLLVTLPRIHISQIGVKSNKGVSVGPAEHARQTADETRWIIMLQDAFRPQLTPFRSRIRLMQRRFVTRVTAPHISLRENILNTCEIPDNACRFFVPRRMIEMRRYKHRVFDRMKVHSFIPKYVNHMLL